MQTNYSQFMNNAGTRQFNGTNLVINPFLQQTKFYGQNPYIVSSRQDYYTTAKQYLPYVQCSQGVNRSCNVRFGGQAAYMQPVRHRNNFEYYTFK